MQIPFSKYHGTGNDFILIDQREHTYLHLDDQRTIEHLCTRHFGIGADGLMLLQQKPGFDFEMIYFNSDGRESSMCGNGGRCIVAFAHRLGVFEQNCRFWAIDGIHEAVIQNSWVELKMRELQAIQTFSDDYFLNTGSPHYVQFVENLETIDLVEEGRKIRYSKDFQPDGTNVNFVKVNDQFIEVATYERGVEDETLSCGTGVVASVIASYLKHKNSMDVAVQTKGGNLKVRFQKDGNLFTNVWLCGSTQFVFAGEINV
jgi:diaminopimelate epimerase